MIDLHERLSEFSYGYGVTRETEMLLKEVGIQAVPFLPSLIHEKGLGFDVAFNRPGAALMLQFKLGQSLQRFRRSSPGQPIPRLDRPFWRFSIDTAEPDGQFETLLKAEQDGAEVYYAAPRFSDWPHYADIFERREVLDNSLLVRPSEIRASLVAQGSPDGIHRIVYDRYQVHVCSEPARVPETDSDAAVAVLAKKVRENKQSAGTILQKLLDGFDDRSSIRRLDQPGVEDEFVTDGDVAYRASEQFVRKQRRDRLANLLERSETRAQAVAMAVGIELWTLGIQLIVAVDTELTALS
jgi:hypothetical protein